MKKNILTKIDKRLRRLEDAVFGREGKIKTGSDAKPGQAKETAFSGATGGVRFLMSKGFFKKKQGLSKVRATLSENDYHYSRQAVHGALNSLARKGGPLVSLEVGGSKVYVERK